MSGLSSPLEAASIINLNVGGCRFATSRQTLLWIPDTFFSSLLSGRHPIVRDETGAIFIDRDPDLFRVILNYLRTRQIDLSSINIVNLKHEAQFYGILPLVRRLMLCKELEVSACGSVLFHAMVPAPQLPGLVEESGSPKREDDSAGSSRQTSSGADESETAPERCISSDGAESERSVAVASAVGAKGGGGSCPSSSPSPPGATGGGGGSSCPSRSGGGGAHKAWSTCSVGGGQARASGSEIHASSCSSRQTFLPTHMKRSSYDLNKFIRNELSALKQQRRAAILRDREVERQFPVRVLLMRAHHNSLAVAYPYYVCVYRMKESIGWQLVYTSSRLPLPARHLAINTKFGPQASEKMLAVAYADGSVDLWCLQDTEPNGAAKIGRFSLSVAVDKLFFIGGQMVALSKSGKVGIWHSMTQNWQVQDVVSSISCHDTAGSSLLLGCANGSMYYIDMQKFPLRMKDNDLLVTELYRDPNGDAITAISVYLTPKTTVCGNWIEIAYGTSSGAVRVIVQHPETVGHGPQLFQTYTVHASPITRVALTTSHLISVCAEYNHVRSWSVTRFRGMISTQPGSTSLASFKVLTLDSTDESTPPDYADPGPYGDQEGEQVFVQRVVPDTNQLFLRLASNGDRLCTIRSVDGSQITSFMVHECEGSTRIGCRPRRFLFLGTAEGNVQMWDVTTALDQYYATRSALVGGAGGQGGQQAQQHMAPAERTALKLVGSSPLLHALTGPSPQELLALIDECDICCQSSRASTPLSTPHASMPHLPGLLGDR